MFVKNVQKNKKFLYVCVYSVIAGSLCPNIFIYVHISIGPIQRGVAGTDVHSAALCKRSQDSLRVSTRGGISIYGVYR